jgi:hypothetical protein
MRGRRKHGYNHGDSGSILGIVTSAGRKRAQRAAGTSKYVLFSPLATSFKFVPEKTMQPNDRVEAESKLMKLTNTSQMQIFQFVKV